MDAAFAKRTFPYAMAGGVRAWEHRFANLNRSGPMNVNNIIYTIDWMRKNSPPNAAATK
jgi:hypothetical protein